MKRLFLLLALSVLFVSAGSTAYHEYIKKYSKIAVKEMKRSGVPASITLAQGLLESAAGQSELSVKGNNHFGIKCHNNWTGKKIYHDAEIDNECFRCYSNAEDSFKDHSDFLRYQNRYKSLFNLDPSDYKGWAYGLKQAGYATDPKYPEKLIKIIEEYELYKYDGNVVVEVERPEVVEAPKKVELNYKEEIKVSLSRPVYEQNGARFVYAAEGETYESIARSAGLFKSEVLKLNDVSSDRELNGGEVVYISPKKKMAAPGVQKLVVGPSEIFTMWDIAQRYGVKLQALCKMNSLPAGYMPQEGDIITLRK